MSRFFALILAFAFAVPVFAFDVSVKANVDNAQVFVGDMFNYEIQVTAPENAIVDLPSFVGNLGSFEVKEMKNEKVTEGMPKVTDIVPAVGIGADAVGGDGRGGLAARPRGRATGPGRRGAGPGV